MEIGGESEQCRRVRRWRHLQPWLQDDGIVRLPIERLFVTPSAEVQGGSEGTGAAVKQAWLMLGP